MQSKWRHCMSNSFFFHFSCKAQYHAYFFARKNPKEIYVKVIKKSVKYYKNKRDQKGAKCTFSTHSLVVCMFMYVIKVIWAMRTLRKYYTSIGLALVNEGGRRITYHVYKNLSRTKDILSLYLQQLCVNINTLDCCIPL